MTPRELIMEKIQQNPGQVLTVLEGLANNFVSEESEEGFGEILISEINKVRELLDWELLDDGSDENDEDDLVDDSGIDDDDDDDDDEDDE